MILDEICAHKRTEVETSKKSVPLSALKQRIAEISPARDFRAALRTPGISLIAEVKKASPSKGVLRANLDPVDMGGLYERSGASAISILTDTKYFQGSLRDLTAVRRHVKVPCLRKEFIVDEYQIYEARAAEADAVLLIARVLSDEQLGDYLALTADLRMDALVETHDAQEIERAMKSGAHILGINNRDLATFEVSLNRTLELKRYVPGGHVLVSESGIHTREHVQLLEDGGIDAILVGECLITSDNVAQKIRELLGRDQS
ncbi:MAG TPA: indole-3-glycerol phosphate synthase TrpC [Candidatus Hydrogenedentes bacterium]|nr:indole-3-glycerol phosphate synthase TrpC [Candidatus Hydrogenedentota bacterium]HQE84237.1 indole-3-glycerol phosphate synthase TrpC [Candidatus Hydrogenedentota bacterium]HQH51073.1 indole-3-glycerol phosphate synthase TrpC [Candidatus Hydrogenedentota bacterium]HQM47685.1 indole-3-glycerol phosphate synthase TrpC [Candidatus Hydrogenedentota bacterium]